MGKVLWVDDLQNDNIPLLVSQLFAGHLRLDRPLHPQEPLQRFKSVLAEQNIVLITNYTEAFWLVSYGDIEEYDFIVLDINFPRCNVSSEVLPELVEYTKKDPKFWEKAGFILYIHLLGRCQFPSTNILLFTKHGEDYKNQFLEHLDKLFLDRPQFLEKSVNADGNGNALTRYLDDKYNRFRSGMQSLTRLIGESNLNNIRINQLLKKSRKPNDELTSKLFLNQLSLLLPLKSNERGSSNGTIGMLVTLLALNWNDRILAKNNRIELLCFFRNMIAHNAVNHQDLNYLDLTFISSLSIFEHFHNVNELNLVDPIKSLLSSNLPCAHEYDEHLVCDRLNYLLKLIIDDIKDNDQYLRTHPFLTKKGRDKCKVEGFDRKTLDFIGYLTCISCISEMEGSRFSSNLNAMDFLYIGLWSEVFYFKSSAQLFTGNKPLRRKKFLDLRPPLNLFLPYIYFDGRLIPERDFPRQ